MGRRKLLYYNDSPLGVVGATQVVTRIAASALVGGSLARRVFAPTAAQVEVDGQPIDPDDFTVMAASSVRTIYASQVASDSSPAATAALSQIALSPPRST